MSTPATSTSTDPVETIIDLLSGTPKADWPSGVKPTHIESRWTSTHHERRQRDGPAVYCWSPQAGPRDQISAEGTVKAPEETVFVECWSDTSAQAASTATDVERILDQYWRDNRAYTTWRHIRPIDSDDRRAEHVPGSRDPYVIVVRVFLRTETDITTAGGL